MRLRFVGLGRPAKVLPAGLPIHRGTSSLLICEVGVYVPEPRCQASVVVWITTVNFSTFPPAPGAPGFDWEPPTL